MTISNTRTNRGLRVLAPLVAMLAVLALLAGACSSDSDSADSSKKDKDSTSTTAKESDNSDTTESTAPKGEDFSTGVQSAMKQLEAAKEPCDVYKVLNEGRNVQPPTTQEDTKLLVQYYEKLLVAASNTATDPATAKVLKDGATKLAAYAESVNYDPKKLDFEGSGPQFEGADEMQSAMQSYSTKDLLSCAPASSTDSQVPTTAP